MILAALVWSAAVSAASPPPRPLRPIDLLDDSSEIAHVPASVRVIRDVAYGSDPAQRFDVYIPPHAKSAPVIFMVHGGGWRRGDKTMKTSVENKLAHWSGRGFIFISINYRLLPTNLLDQARDVARALAAAQAKARAWGGDPAKFVLMGHSAGSHLIALVASSPAIARDAGAKPWLGTVLLDSAALDVVAIMTGRHMRLYDEAFGSDPSFWRAASPYHVMTKATPPILAVCSSRRADSCAQATQFTAKTSTLGTRASVLERDLSHREINDLLGKDSGYTAAVDAFVDRLFTSSSVSP